MPIKFRCAYCSQLMAIGRRKSGSVVICPTCNSQVIVPTVEGPASPSPAPVPKPNVFERPDFDPAEFNPNSPHARAAAAQPPTLVTPQSAHFEAQPLTMPSPSSEKLMMARHSKRNWALLILIAVTLVAIGFAAGFVTAKLM